MDYGREDIYKKTPLAGIYWEFLVSMDMYQFSLSTINGGNPLNILVRNKFSLSTINAG